MISFWLRLHIVLVFFFFFAPSFWDQSWFCNCKFSILVKLLVLVDLNVMNTVWDFVSLDWVLYRISKINQHIKQRFREVLMLKVLVLVDSFLFLLVKKKYSGIEFKGMHSWLSNICIINTLWNKGATTESGKGITNFSITLCKSIKMNDYTFLIKGTHTNSTFKGKPFNQCW